MPIPLPTDQPPSFVATVPVPPSTVTSTEAFDGEVFTFEGATTVQYSPLGEPIVVTTSGGRLMSNTSAFLIKDGYAANGAMIDPLLSFPQGFDGTMANAALGVADSYTYSDTVNKTPTGPNGPLSWTAGDQFTLIQSRARNITRTNSTIQAVDKYIPLTFVPTALPAGDFRPGVGKTVKTNYGANVANVRFNVFRNLTKPTDGYDIATATANSLRRGMTPYWSAGTASGGVNDDMKRKQENDFAAGSTGFAANYAPERAMDLCALHWSATDAAKQAMAYYVVQRGIDARSLHEQAALNGRRLFGAGGGQNHGHWPYVVAAGFILNDPSFLTVALDMRTNANIQPFLLSNRPFLVGRYTKQTNAKNTLPQTYFQEHMFGWNQGDISDMSASNLASYYADNDAGTMLEILAIMLLQNGPGGITGGEWLAANGYQASIDVADEYAKETPLSGYWSAASRQQAKYQGVYNAVRASLTPAVRAIPPAQLFSNKSHVTALASGFNWNHKSVNASQATITDRQVEISLDARSWVRFTGLSATTQDIITGVMTGTPHIYRARRVSANGPGIWSRAEPEGRTSATGAYGPGPYFTPTNAAATGTPVNSKLPSLVFRPYPAWFGLRFEECPATVPATVGRLYPAVGYWFGGGKPTQYNVRIKQGGATIWTGTFDETGTLGYKLGSDLGYLDITPAMVGAGTLTVEVDGVMGGDTTTATSIAYTPSATPSASYYVPEWKEPLKDLTYRWNPGTGLLSFYGGDLGNDFHSVNLGSGATSAPRMVSIDRLAPLGDLTSVPEGEVVLVHANGGNLLGNGARRGVWIRATGADSASANGYLVEATINHTSGTYAYSIYKCVAGILGAPIYTSPTPIPMTDTSIGPVGDQYGGTHAFMRVNWSLSASNLIIKIKGWRAQSFIWSPYEEPASWEVMHDAGVALTSGRVGIGYSSSSRGWGMRGFGLSTNPASPALLNPPIPSYTYS